MKISTIYKLYTGFKSLMSNIFDCLLILVIIAIVIFALHEIIY